MSKVYSLAQVSVTIQSNFGNISFGGNGVMLGSVQYSWDQAPFQRLAKSADGGSVVSHNGYKGGTISIALNQASNVIANLIDLCLKCRQDPANASLTLHIDDGEGLGNINIDGIDGFVTTIPNFTYQTGNISNRTFVFDCGELVDNTIGKQSTLGATNV